MTKFPPQAAATDPGGRPQGSLVDLAEAFPVGQFIAEELKARGWTAPELALRMGWSTGHDAELNQLSVEMLIACPDARVGDLGATQLGLAFGVPAEFFLNLERSYFAWKDKQAPEDK